MLSSYFIFQGSFLWLLYKLITHKAWKLYDIVCVLQFCFLFAIVFLIMSMPLHLSKGKAGKYCNKKCPLKWNNAMGFKRMYRFTDLFSYESSYNTGKYIDENPLLYFADSLTLLWLYGNLMITRSEYLRLSDFSIIEHDRLLTCYILV